MDRALVFILCGAIHASAGVLPHLRDGIRAATALVEARIWGLITQPHYRSATDPAPPPSPDPRSGPGFP